MDANAEVVCFGEIMMRLSPPDHQRLTQAFSLELRFGGGEANVAVALAQFGTRVQFVSAVPDHEVGQACVNTLRAWGVGTDHIARSGTRLGIYFLEHGAGPRPSKVIYDRSRSSFAERERGSYDWGAILKGASWFHFTGITPALSKGCFDAVRDAAATASRNGLRVSCDLNYRSKLWSRKEAGAAMSELMPYVDTLFANEEDADSVFGIRASNTDVEAGRIDRERYVDVARQLQQRFELSNVGITLRESFSASRNGWSGLVYREGDAFFSKRYEIDIVDRVGSGDSFAAGAIYGLLKNRPPQEVVEMAAAAGCLAHTIAGDFGVSSLAEVEALAGGEGSGRVQR